MKGKSSETAFIGDQAAHTCSFESIYMCCLGSPHTDYNQAHAVLEQIQVAQLQGYSAFLQFNTLTI